MKSEKKTKNTYSRTLASSIKAKVQQCNRRFGSNVTEQNTFLQRSLSLKDVLHFQKTSDTSNESDILARYGFYKQTAQRKYMQLHCSRTRTSRDRKLYYIKYQIIIRDL